MSPACESFSAMHLLVTSRQFRRPNDANKEAANGSHSIDTHLTIFITAMNDSTRFEYPIAGPDAYAADPCVPPPSDGDIEVFTTDDGVEYVQTPDFSFSDLEGYPWEPNYVTVDGMRMHYIDVKLESSSTSDEIVLMLHGQPSWSFLYRKMVPILVERGNRVICPDWLGMGKSDKPIDLKEHTYLKHVERLKSFIKQVIPEALVEPTITLFVQDWGSLIGLRTVGDKPSWFKRVVSANGLLPVISIPDFSPFQVPTPVNYNCSDNRTVLDMAQERRANAPCGLDQSCFSIWIDFALTNPTWNASDILQLASSTMLSNSFLASYDAPFPSRTYMAAIRAFPSMIAAVYEPEFGNVAAWESLQNFSRPFLALAGEDDPNLGSVEMQSNLYNNIFGASVHSFEHKRYAGAGHFIQEDAGEEVATYVADFIDGTPVGDGNSTVTSNAATACSSTTVGFVYVLLYLTFKLARL